MSKKKVQIKEIDSKHTLPEEYKDTKKDIFDHIRKASRGQIGDNDEISEEIFKGFTDLESIEKLIFGNVLENKHDLFVVRLYVVKNELNSLKDKVKGIFASFVTEIGTNHVAVQVADKMIHWYDCGMVLVQEYEGSKAAAVFYPQDKEQETVPALENTPEIRKKICKVIQQYNCEKKYDLKKCNCQNFAKDLFTSMDLLSEFTKMKGPIGWYLQYIIGDGRNSKKHAFLVDGKGKVVKDQNNKKLHWETHEELDKWTKENIENFQLYNDLIKGFHRAFQMRERSALKRNPNAEVYKSQNCYYGLPTRMVKSQNEKVEIDHYDIETSVSTSFSGLSGISGTSGVSSISSNKN